jgi:predicted DNA-binding protein YlxM (UPF0122 family)
MQGFSKKSQEIIDYRVANKHLTMKAIATHFGVKKQWVYVLCKRAGVQSAAEPYEGSILYVRNVPVDIVESVKTKAREEGLTMRMKVIQLLENYGKGIDNS